jgi:hypothetical protein
VDHAKAFVDAVRIQPNEMLNKGLRTKKVKIDAMLSALLSLVFT